MSKDSELLNAIKKLTTSINELNRKTTTPLDTNRVVSGFATKFGLISLGSSDTFTTSANGPLCYNNDYYYAVNGNDVVRWKESATSSTNVYTGLPSNAYAITYDSINDYLYVGEEPTALYGGGVNGKVWVINALTGALVRTLTIQNPVMPPSEIVCDALAYDTDNDKIYIFYSGFIDGHYGARWGVLNPISGKISNYHDLPYARFAESGTRDASYYNGALYAIWDSGRGGTTVGITGFDILTETTIFDGSVISTSLIYFFINPNTNIWEFWDGTATSFTHGGLSFIQRISIHDDGGTTISIDDGGGSITVDATSLPLPTGAATAGNQTTMITALQLIDDLRNALKTVNTDQLVVEQEAAPSVADSNVVATQAAGELVATRASRRGLIIQNADTTDTVWIGDSGVTTATGIELLPKQVIALNNYTGATASIYGICSAGKTADVRILEVF